MHEICSDRMDLKDFWNIYDHLQAKNWDNRMFCLVHRFTSAQLFLVFRSEYTLCTCRCTVGKKQVPFSMATGNEELVHECSFLHLHMGTARLKWDKETDWEEVGNQKRVKMKRVQWARKKQSRRSNYSSGLPSLLGRNSPKKWMNYLTNLTFNPSTTP